MILRIPGRPLVWKNPHDLGSSGPRGNEGEEDRKSDFAGVITAGPGSCGRDGSLRGG